MTLETWQILKPDNNRKLIEKKNGTMTMPFCMITTLTHQVFGKIPTHIM